MSHQLVITNSYSKYETHEPITFYRVFSYWKGLVLSHKYHRNLDLWPTGININRGHLLDLTTLHNKCEVPWTLALISYWAETKCAIRTGGRTVLYTEAIFLVQQYPRLQKPRRTLTVTPVMSLANVFTRNKSQYVPNTGTDWRSVGRTDRARGTIYIYITSLK